MGWASGSYMAEELFDEIRPLIKKGKILKVARILKVVFDNRDADDWDYSDPDSLASLADPEGRQQWVEDNED